MSAQMLLRNLVEIGSQQRFLGWVGERNQGSHQSFFHPLDDTCAELTHILEIITGSSDSFCRIETIEIVSTFLRGRWVSIEPKLVVCDDYST
jgi:hypothetical protein